MKNNQLPMGKVANLNSINQPVDSLKEAREIDFNYDFLIEESEKIINTSELEYKFRSGSPDD